MSQVVAKIRIKSLVLFLLSSVANIAVGAVSPVQVTTFPGISIEIDLSSSISSDVTDPNVTIAQAPTSGTAVKKPNTTQVIIYTPNSGVANTEDTFVYQVINNGLPEQATVTVTIGDVATQGSTPEQAISDTLAQVVTEVLRQRAEDLGIAHLNAAWGQPRLALGERPG